MSYRFTALKHVPAQPDSEKVRGRLRPVAAAAKGPCQFGQMHCPVYGRWHGGVFVKNYECVDIQHDLESCGGCKHNYSLDGDTSGLGEDCSQIVGVDTVRCVQGRCVIGEAC